MIAVVVLRCTGKLSAKLDGESGTGVSTGALGDWYATLIHTRRGQLVLAISGVTLLPIVVTGRELKAFPARLAAGLDQVLSTYAVSRSAIDRECAAFDAVVYAKTDDRSTVGVMTDFQRAIPYFVDDALTPLEMSLQLARTPIVARDLFPIYATCDLFGVAHPPR